MTKTEYKEYLKTPGWQARRKEAFKYHGSMCASCFMPRWLAEIAYDQDLHVNHLTYARRGHEDMDDLELLCRRCHEIETFGRSEIRKPKEATCDICCGAHWNYRSPMCDICAHDDYTPIQRGFLNLMRMAISDAQGNAAKPVFSYFAMQRLSQMLCISDNPMEKMLGEDIYNLSETIPDLFGSK